MELLLGFVQPLDVLRGKKARNRTQEAMVAAAGPDTVAAAGIAMGFVRPFPGEGDGMRKAQDQTGEAMSAAAVAAAGIEAVVGAAVADPVGCPGQLF